MMFEPIVRPDALYTAGPFCKLAESVPLAGQTLATGPLKEVVVKLLATAATEIGELLTRRGSSTSTASVIRSK
jgi:hypothetical protein